MCLTAADVTETLDIWSTVTRSGRILAVIDVSLSMNRSAGRRPRIEVVKRAAQRGLSRLGDHWAAGLWAFSTNLNGSGDHVELVATRLLTADQRRALLAALHSLELRGDTGLYDTVLAAYHAALSGWDPDRSNAVVVLTDGRNDDTSGGVTRIEDLRDELRAVADPQRPVTLVLVGIGEANIAELRQIADAVGGGAYVVDDPAGVDDIFPTVVAQRLRDR